MNDFKRRSDRANVLRGYVCVELGGMYVNGHTGNYVTVLHFFCTNNPHADEIRVKVGCFFRRKIPLV